MRLGLLDEAHWVGQERWPVTAKATLVEDALNLQGGQTACAGAMETERQVALASVEVDGDRSGELLESHRKSGKSRGADGADRG